MKVSTIADKGTRLALALAHLAGVPGVKDAEKLFNVLNAGKSLKDGLIVNEPDLDNLIQEATSTAIEALQQSPEYRPMVGFDGAPNLLSLAEVDLGIALTHVRPTEDLLWAAQNRPAEAAQSCLEAVLEAADGVEFPGGLDKAGSFSQLFFLGVLEASLKKTLLDGAFMARNSARMLGDLAEINQSIYKEVSNLGLGFAGFEDDLEQIRANQTKFLEEMRLLRQETKASSTGFQLSDMSGNADAKKRPPKPPSKSFTRDEVTTALRKSTDDVLDLIEELNATDANGAKRLLASAIDTAQIRYRSAGEEICRLLNLSLRQSEIAQDIEAAADIQIYQAAILHPKIEEQNEAIFDIAEERLAKLAVTGNPIDAAIAAKVADHAVGLARSPTQRADAMGLVARSDYMLGLMDRSSDRLHDALSTVEIAQNQLLEGKDIEQMSELWDMVLQGTSTTLPEDATAEHAAEKFVEVFSAIERTPRWLSLEQMAVHALTSVAYYENDPVIAAECLERARRARRLLPDKSDRDQLRRNLDNLLAETEARFANIKPTSDQQIQVAVKSLLALREGKRANLDTSELARLEFQAGTHLATVGETQGNLLRLGRAIDRIYAASDVFRAKGDITIAALALPSIVHCALAMYGIDRDQEMRDYARETIEFAIAELESSGFDDLRESLFTELVKLN